MNKWLLSSAVILFSVITILSLLPPESGVELPEYDKVGHFLAYTLFSWNVALLFKERKTQIIALILVFLYSMLIEFIQGFIPGREPSGLDLIANASGIMIGFIANKLLASHVRRLLP